MSPVGRMAAVGAIALALVAVAVVLLGGEDKYQVHVRFQSANKLVEGGLVQLSGRPVGKVKAVELTSNNEADVLIELDEEEGPLRQGTEAVLRLASLSGSANRYVDLRVPEGSGGPTIPDGGTIPASETTSLVDVDQFFSLFDEQTRKGLRKFIRGSQNQHDGSRGQDRYANEGYTYLNPSLVAARRLFDEVGYDTPSLQRFLVATSKLVTDVAERDADLAQLIDRLATTTGAIADEERSLSQAIATLPPFMRRANTTFVNLRAALDDLDPVVEASKPNVPKLRALLAELRPLAENARQPVKDLARTIRRPGAHNDLLELARSVPPLRDIAIGPVRRNGAERPGSFPSAVRSLAGQRPHLAFFRPYSVDFTGWLDDFSHSGIYDANGSASRNALTVAAFQLAGSQLQPVPQELRNQVFDRVTRSGQNNRCPGAVERPAEDGGNPWKPSPDFFCDPTQIPPGR